MNDLISRQGAIDTAAEYENELREILGDENELVEVVKILKHRLIALPSAQPEPCDAISRADAIRVASGYCHPANVAEELAKLPSVQPEPHYTDDQIQKMQDMEQAQLNKAFELGRKDAKWIPCSERLPEEKTDVLLQFRQNMAVGFWENILEYDNDVTWYANSGDGYFTDCATLEGYDDPIAWMPLPEPYREEGE